VKKQKKSATLDFTKLRPDSPRARGSLSYFDGMQPNSRKFITNWLPVCDDSISHINSSIISLNEAIPCQKKRFASFKPTQYHAPQHNSTISQRMQLRYRICKRDSPPWHNRQSGLVCLSSVISYQLSVSKSSRDDPVENAIFSTASRTEA